MKTRNLLVCIALAGLSLCSCSKGENAASTTTPTVPQQIEAAASYLVAGNITGARAAYTAIIDGASAQIAKDADTSAAGAHFGRALCDIILLIEKDPFTAILAGFGQSPWAASSVFGPTGYLAQSLAVDNPDLSGLPFNNTAACMDTIRAGSSHLNRCLLIKVASGYTIESLASSLTGLMTYVDTIISDLDAAIADGGATFTIPKGLYSGDADITVNHADMIEILSGMHMIKAGSDFANSWRFDSISPRWLT